MKVRVMMTVIMIITDTHDSTGVTMLHSSNERDTDQHVFFFLHALALCPKLIPIRLCMVGGDASRRQQVTPHLPLSL